MAWLEAHQKLRDSGKVILLAEKLGINRHQTIGHLFALWWWALDNVRNGDVTRYRNAIVTVMGWKEYADQCYAEQNDNHAWDVDIVKPLVECGFLDEENGVLSIHDWEEYTWRYYETIDKSTRNKELSKERVKRWRNAQVTRNNIVTVTPKKRDVTHPTVPDLTIPNLTTQKEDKDTPLPPRDGFDMLWERYPRREGRKAAEHHFMATVKTTKQWLDIQNALDNYLAKIRRDRTEERYIKMGSTWFNDWESFVDYAGGTHGGNDGKGSDHITALWERARANRRAEGLRKVTEATAGSILTGVRADAVDKTKVAGRKDREPRPK